MNTLRRLYQNKAIKLGVQLLVLGGCLFFVIQQLATQWATARQTLAGANIGLLLLSVLCVVLGFLFLPLGMVIFSGHTTQRITYKDSAKAYYGSQLTKYLPGAIWVYPSRIVLLKERGYPIAETTPALAFETVSLLLSSSFVSSIVLLAAGGELSLTLRRLLLLGALGTLAALFALLFMPQVIHRALPEPPPALTQLTAISLGQRLVEFGQAFAAYSLMWLLVGCGFFFALTSLFSGLQPEILPLALGTFVFSWFVGFISIVSPGGIGVRESVIVLLLAPVVAAPYPVLSALVLRLVWTLVEVGLFFLASLYN